MLRSEGKAGQIKTLYQLNETRPYGQMKSMSVKH